MQYLWPLASVAIAGGIFFSSAMPGDASGEASMSIIHRVMAWFPFLPFTADTLNFILRKGAHFVVFFALAFSLMHALKYYIKKPARLFFWAWGISAAYGILDELHQLFVPGRGCEIRDMVINAAGAACGAALVRVWLLRGQRHIVEGSDSSLEKNTYS